MERRYLVAVVVMSATFAATSHGFRALQKISLAHARHSGAMAHSRCDPSAALRALARICTRLRPRYPEDAQLLAEMNVPFANMETTMAEQMAQRNSAIAQCAGAQAMWDAERARRDAMRMQEKMTRAVEQAGAAPMALEINLPSDLDQRIQTQMAILTARLAANGAKLQIASDKLRESSIQLENLNLPIVEVTDDGGRVSTRVHNHVNCNANAKRTGQQPQ
ncbi:MAG: hypothetical protein ABSD98_14590 [Candidatus Korobacteraceae bacterium]|jgi:hypothetical protein